MTSTALNQFTVIRFVRPDQERGNSVDQQVLQNDVPLVLIEDGHMFKDRMMKASVREDDILEWA